jgi:hypothetical protein
LTQQTNKKTQIMTIRLNYKTKKAEVKFTDKTIIECNYSFSKNTEPDKYGAIYSTLTIKK